MARPSDSTVNEDLRDAIVRHQVQLMRLSAGLRRRIAELLNRTEMDLRREIVRRLERGTDIAHGPTARRLRALEGAIRELRRAAVAEAMAEVRAEAEGLARHEAEFTAATIHRHAPVELDVVVPTAETLRSLVSKRPFQGKVLSRWAKKIADDDVARITDQIRIGMTEGEGADDIAKRVVGTARLAGADGATEITRRNAATLARTAVNFFANEAKREVYEANRDIIKEEVYLATLDSRTTPVCRALDGNRYPVGEGPRPPQHFGCRSVRVPALDPVGLGGRPFKASTERQLVREYSEREGLEEGLTERDDLPYGHKSRFDDFARRRTRELTGQTPAETTYQDFLERQSAEFQDDVLGKTKGRLFRRGGLTLDRFVDRNGNELTLEELARREHEAFRKAGIDPRQFTAG